mgnify:CR=1 FL=1
MRVRGGSAAKVTAALETEGIVAGLDLGRVDAAHADTLLPAFNEYLRSRGSPLRCAVRPGPGPDVSLVVAEGAAWTSRTYVRMVTAALDAGATRLLVGTRGIFGEAIGSGGVLVTGSVVTVGEARSLIVRPGSDKGPGS